MFRRQHLRTSGGRRHPVRKRGRQAQVTRRRQYWVERLEERYMLAVNPVGLRVTPPPGSTTVPVVPSGSQSSSNSTSPPSSASSPQAGTNLLQVDNFPLSETF